MTTVVEHDIEKQQQELVAEFNAEAKALEEKTLKLIKSALEIGEEVKIYYSFEVINLPFSAYGVSFDNKLIGSKCWNLAFTAQPDQVYSFPRLEQVLIHLETHLGIAGDINSVAKQVWDSVGGHNPLDTVTVENVINKHLDASKNVVSKEPDQGIGRGLTDVQILYIP